MEAKKYNQQALLVTLVAVQVPAHHLIDFFFRVRPAESLTDICKRQPNYNVPIVSDCNYLERVKSRRHKDVSISAPGASPRSRQVMTRHP
jgi:hypothetical protein